MNEDDRLKEDLDEIIDPTVRSDEDSDKLDQVLKQQTLAKPPLSEIAELMNAVVDINPGEPLDERLDRIDDELTLLNEKLSEFETKFENIRHALDVHQKLIDIAGKGRR